MPVYSTANEVTKQHPPTLSRNVNIHTGLPATIDSTLVEPIAASLMLYSLKRVLNNKYVTQQSANAFKVVHSPLKDVLVLPNNVGLIHCVSKNVTLFIFAKTWLNIIQFQ